jgi:hypothetical protein
MMAIDLRPVSLADENRNRVAMRNGSRALLRRILQYRLRHNREQFVASKAFCDLCTEHGIIWSAVR